MHFNWAPSINYCFRINFWIHAVIIKLLPCFILTIISFVLIDVLCRANKRKLKLKGYSKDGAALNGHRWVKQIAEGRGKLTSAAELFITLFSYRRQANLLWTFPATLKLKPMKRAPFALYFTILPLGRWLSSFAKFVFLRRPSRIDRRTDRTTMLLVAVLLLFLFTEFPQGILGLLSGIMGKW